MSIIRDEDFSAGSVSMSRVLERFGWDEHWAKQFVPFREQGFVPARVVCEHREGYDVIGDSGEFRAEISGRFRYDHPIHTEWPAVGDWVAIASRPAEGTATVHGVIPRRSRFSRTSPGDRTVEQIVAANVAIVFLVTGLDGNFNLRRIERYLAMAWESGARPVIVLNKADICADVAACVSEVENIAFSTPVIPLSAATGQGVEALQAFLSPGMTGAFLGSSGVGKSSLVNALIGGARQTTQAVRSTDSRGRHTTTNRELILLPQGGLIIDTPGMRELQIWAEEDGVGSAFSDVESLVAQCRFTDCSHSGEPGCAIVAALEAGSLRQDRLRSYLKLQREVQYQAMRQEHSARYIERSRWKKISQEIRRIERDKGNQ